MKKDDEEMIKSNSIAAVNVEVIDQSISVNG